VQDPRGFMRYSCGTHIKCDPHVVVRVAHGSIVGFMVKILFSHFVSEKDLNNYF
jgi:hypothetical protein